MIEAFRRGTFDLDCTMMDLRQRKEGGHRFNALRETFGSADYVAPFTVFNIDGNKYRLIAVIHYNRRNAYIRQVLPHAEYDRNKWKRRN